jgi:hypothetical protein
LRSQSSFDSQTSRRRNSSHEGLSPQARPSQQLSLQRQNSFDSQRRATRNETPPVPRSDDGNLLGLDDLYVSDMHRRDMDSDNYMLFDAQGRESPCQRSESNYPDSSPPQEMPLLSPSRHHSITPFSALEDSSFTRAEMQRQRRLSAPDSYLEQQPRYHEDGGQGRMRSQSSFDSQASRRRNSSHEGLSPQARPSQQLSLQRQNSFDSQRRGGTRAGLVDSPPPVPRSDDGSLLGLDDLYVSDMHRQDMDSDNYMLFDAQGRESPRGGGAPLTEFSRQRSGSSYRDPPPSQEMPPSSATRHQSITPFSDPQRSRTSSAPESYLDPQHRQGEERLETRLRSQSSFDRQDLHINQRRKSRLSISNHPGYG